MKKIAKFAVTTLASLTLFACSSGGGSNSGESTPSTSTPSTSTPSTSTPSTSTPSTSTPSTSTPSTSTPAKSDKAFSGYSFAFRGIRGEPASPQDTKDISGDTFDKIVIEGKELSLIPNGPVDIANRPWTDANELYFCCATQNDSDPKIESVKIGAVVDKNAELVRVFAYGKTTPVDQIPTSGEVVYEGVNSGKLIILGDPDDNGLSTAYSTRINANFDKKEVSGYLLSTPTEAVFNIDGKISGNNIVDGKVELRKNNENNRQALKIDNDQQLSAPLNAKFYGENAKEVAGTAHNEKWGVIFAASKK